MKIPDGNSPGSYWIKWHQYLVGLVGKSDATGVFLQHFATTGQKSEAANDASLRSYAKSQGMPIEGENGIFSWGADSWKDTQSGVSTIGNMTTIGIFVVVIMVGVAGYFLFIKQN
jgi:hypothetical protein